MADDLISPAKRAVGVILVALGALFTAAAPVFGLTYTQPDMGLLIIIVVFPVLWIIGVVFGCLAVALRIARWQRIGGIVLLSVAGAEVVALIAFGVVNITTR
jgi:hypothetical protein